MCFEIKIENISVLEYPYRNIDREFVGAANVIKLKDFVVKGSR